MNCTNLSFYNHFNLDKDQRFHIIFFFSILKPVVICIPHQDVHIQRLALFKNSKH